MTGNVKSNMKNKLETNDGQFCSRKVISQRIQSVVKAQIITIQKHSHEVTITWTLVTN